MQILLHLVVAAAIALMATAEDLLDFYFGTGDMTQANHLYLAGIVIISGCWVFFIILTRALWAIPEMLDLERRVTLPSIGSGHKIDTNIR